MKSFLAIFAIVGTVFCLSTSRPELDPNVPFYVGDVFWPPVLTAIVWLPSEVQKELEVGVKVSYIKAADSSFTQ